MTTKKQTPGRKKMARQKDKNLIHGSGVDRKVYHETIRGYRIWLCTIPPLKQEKIYKAMEQDPDWGKRPPPLMYEIELAGGTKIEKPHNDTTLQTEEEKLAYANRQKEQKEWDAELGMRLLRSFLVDGIRMYIPQKWIDKNAELINEIDDEEGTRFYENELHELYIENVIVPDTARWVKRHKFQNLTVPDDPFERYVHFIETEIVGSNEEAEQLGSIIRRLSGIIIEDLSSAERLFQG